MSVLKETYKGKLSEFENYRKYIVVTRSIFIHQGTILLHYLAARPGTINTKSTKVKGEIAKGHLTL
jgi:hypothetical protein